LPLQYNFEWNPIKNLHNIRKHGIGFELSASVFSDPRALTVFDDEHSDSEERWITLGISQTGILLVAHHTYEIINETQIRIRIFSARKASQKEHQHYRRI
jgi:uncharacterized DUF497 family protein